MNIDFDTFKTYLGPGERMLWSGQPRQGVLLRGSDALMIPFSLFWGGFAFFWEYSVATSNAPWFFVLWGIPFVLVGLYLIVGRFYVEARSRSTTYYAVTNERVLILSGLFNRQVKSLNLRTLTDLSFTQGGNGEGTITFGSGPSYPAVFGSFRGWPGANNMQAPCFELIADVKSVYELIRGAQRAST